MLMALEYLGLSPANPNSENTWLGTRTIVERRFDNSAEEGFCISGKAAMKMVAMLRTTEILLQQCNNA